MEYNNFNFECSIDSSINNWFGKYKCDVTSDYNEFHFSFHFEDSEIYDWYDDDSNEEEHEIAIKKLWSKFHKAFIGFIESSNLDSEFEIMIM